MNKSEKQTIYELKDTVAPLFGSRCFITGARLTKEHTLSFHHLWYLPNEKRYKDFPNTIEYHRYLIPLIIKNPKRFILVEPKIHHIIGQMARWSPKKFNKIVKVVRLTK
jgi:hypothetical protein